MPYFYITLLVLIMDQAVKWIVQTHMFPFQSISLFRGWPSLTYAQNDGAAFGILPSQTLLFIGLTLVVLAVIWFYRRHLKEYPRIFQIGLALALGGALGNFIDRVRLGYVVDFMDLHFWPVFNIADVGIIGGVFLVGIGMFWRDLQRFFGTSLQTNVPETGNPVNEEENR